MPWTAIRSGVGPLQVPWTAIRSGVGTLQVPWTTIRSGAVIGLLSLFESDSFFGFAGEFDELRFVMPQVMIIKLKVEDPKILFDPSFRDCRDIILRCFSEIIASGEGLSRVECELFPEMKGQRLLLRSVKIEEALVAEYTDKVMEIFKKNTIGPQK